MRKKLAVIGAGNMGCAICDGLIASGKVKPENLYLCRRNVEKLSEYKNIGCYVTNDMIEAVSSCDSIMLAVKPQMFASVMDEISELVSDKLVISIAAGITVATMEKALHGAHIARVMPNTPLMVGEGVSAVCYGNSVADEDKAFTESIFNSSGICFEIDEKDMNSVPAVTSSSIAYFARIIGVMTNWAAQNGFASLGEEKICELVAKAALGTSKIILEKNMKPSALVSAVASPNGTTEASLKYFDKRDFDDILYGAMTACTDRANELSASK